MTPPTRADLQDLLSAQTPAVELLPRFGELLAGLAEEEGDAHERIALLEDLRTPLWRAMAQYEQQELARALPFSDAEMQRWQSYIEAWSLTLAAYLRALAEAGQEGMAGLVPLLLQRVVRQAVQVALACFRAYQAVQPDLWLLVHEQLRRAEKLGVSEIAVADPTIDREWRGSIADACLHLLLLDFCDPYGFAPGQLVLASRWTERLARQARFSLEPVAHGPSGFLVVDLEQGAGMRLLTEPAGNGAAHYVDIAAARDSIKRLLAKLRLGILPAELYLGDDCTREDAEHILERIHRRWRTSQRRAHPRRVVDELVRIAPGLVAVHRYLRWIAEGHVPELCEGLNESRLVDQSPSGLGLIQGVVAQRLRCQQLVALVARREVLLGSVRWLTVDPPTGLRFGVRVIAGRAHAGALRTSSTAPGELEPVLCLPAMPALDERASLIASPGTYFPDREAELLRDGDAPRRLRLERLMETGADFERISYQPVP